MTTTEPPFVTHESNAYIRGSEYADRHGVSHRTIKRWLKNGELPGAYQDDKGWWLVPANAVHEPKAIVPATPSPAQPGTAVALSTPLTSEVAIELLPEMINRLPTLLTLDQAAYLLNIPKSSIVHDRKYFRVRKINRRLVMPLSRIKKLRGVS